MNLGRLREDLGLSQEEVARHAGITRTALSLIENRRLRPSLRTLNEIERALDPFQRPTRLMQGSGAIAAAESVRELAAQFGREYALTLDVASWLLVRYQTPATAWVYVRDPRTWGKILAGSGVRSAGPSERADLVLLRGSREVFGGCRDHEGFRLVSLDRLISDCARLGGRRWLDAARLYLEFPAARKPGLRLDADAMLKVMEEVVPRTSKGSRA
ncbi:MAG TPA: helix-turn-helix transcriptional regulator [Thermoplasmata archaeon]|nr:helix-turn-helix transcriptional regulator [Thermoplasmata archaeon]